MTICVSVKVSEGLVLAADSTATIQGQVFNKQIGQPVSGVLKTYDNACKLSHLKDYPIGTLTWGSYMIASRSVESLIKEYEYSLPSLQEEQEKSKLTRLKSENTPGEFTYQVKDIAQGLFLYIKSFYDSNFQETPIDQRPPLGILVSGFSSKEFFPEQWLIDFPGQTEIVLLRPDIDGKPDFGASWFGLTDAIVRLHWGRDDAAIQLLSDHFHINPDEVKTVLDGLQYLIVFDGMPLQDAIDFSTYLVNVVIGRFRFVLGAPVCGGEIDVAVITPNAFTWVNRKTWKIK